MSFPVSESRFITSSFKEMQYIDDGGGRPLNNIFPPPVLMKTWEGQFSIAGSFE